MATVSVYLANLLHFNVCFDINTERISVFTGRPIIIFQPQRFYYFPVSRVVFAARVKQVYLNNICLY